MHTIKKFQTINQVPEYDYEQENSIIRIISEKTA